MDLVAELTTRRVLAIVRADSASQALTCVRAAVAGGIRAVEVSLTTPDAAEAIATARRELDRDVLVGAGTVMTAEQANQVAEAGAEFVVTPALTAGGQYAAEIGMPLLCGALTPTEIVTAMEIGAAAVKVFPASAHGPGYLRELRGPFPGLPLVAVGVGSPLFGDAGRGGDPTPVTGRAQAFMTALL